MSNEKDLFLKAAELQSSALDAALCVVVEISGSTPRKVGAKMIVIDNGEDHGEIIGTIGGGAIEHLIRKNSVIAIRNKKPKLMRVSLRNELGMCCGGEMTVFMEPIKKTPKFICFGAGHIAQVLCPLVKNLGFLVTVIDERKDLLNLQAFNEMQKSFDCSSFSIKEMNLDDSYVLISTHDHSLDQKIVEDILPHRFKYGALVGSKRKSLMVKKRLIAKGFLLDSERLFCPAGLDILANTPEEIALSIAAQMVMIKNA